MLFNGFLSRAYQKQIKASGFGYVRYQMPTKIEPLNTSAIQNFIQLVKSADSSNSKEIRMPISQAKNLLK